MNPFNGKTAESSFFSLVEQLHSSDADKFDDAFESLHRHLDQVESEVLEAMIREADPHVKGALLELLGETRNPKYIAHIAKHLDATDVEVRFWAIAALQRIGTNEALRIANEHRQR